MGRVVRMRAEDRKPSRRVFPLLQNLDLDSVTFDQVQGVGEPITIEDMNEQEMVDLIIVNLARLCVSGEWTGLLEAGGGNEFNAELTNYDWDGDADPVRIMALPPFGCINRQHTQSAGDNNNLMFHAFIAPKTGTISEVDIYVGGTSGGTGAVDIGFYSDNGGVPQTFLGEFVLATTSLGTVTQTTSSADVETVRGTQYWVGLFFDNMASGPTFTNIEISEAGTAAICTALNGVSAVDLTMVEADASATGNHTISDYTALAPTSYDPINIGVKW